MDEQTTRTDRSNGRDGPPANGSRFLNTCALHWWNPAAQVPEEGCGCRKPIEILIGGQPYPGLFADLLQPLPEASGTFSGSFDIEDPLMTMTTEQGSVMHIMAPVEDLPWLKHWFYVVMERFFGWEYPTEEIFVGQIETVDIRQERDATIVEGTFKK